MSSRPPSQIVGSSLNAGLHRSCNRFSRIAKADSEFLKHTTIGHGEPLAAGWPCETASTAGSSPAKEATGSAESRCSRACVEMKARKRAATCAFHGWGNCRVCSAGGSRLVRVQDSQPVVRSCRTAPEAKKTRLRLAESVPTRCAICSARRPVLSSRSSRDATLERS